MSGQTVTILPSGVSFEVPESWTKQIYKKSLFLSWDELNEVNKPAIPDFELETSAILDAVIPFDDCATHVGEKGWNIGVVSEQLRVYISNESAETILDRIETKGLRIAKDSFDEAKLLHKPVAGWENKSIKYVHAPSHAILIREISFYIKRQNDKSLVFVFIGGGDDTVLATLKSLTISN